MYKRQAQALAEEVGVAWTTQLEEMLKWKPQIVAEAASVEAVKANAIAVLQGGADRCV